MESETANIPDFNQAKYLEIILRPRQMIYIPHGWFYTFKVAQDGDILSSDSESVFSFLLKKIKFEKNKVIYSIKHIIYNENE